MSERARERGRKGQREGRMVGGRERWWKGGRDVRGG